jgi:hypothetical protein
VEGLPWPAITAAGGGWALFGITSILLIRAFIRGDAVPRSTLDDALHDRDEWRAEGRIKDAQIAEKDRQLGHLEEVGKTVEQLARGLQQEMRKQ